MSLSRKKMMATATAVAVLGMPLLTALGEAAQHMDPNDLNALQSLLELERAGIKAYTDAAATGLLSPGVIAVAQRFMRDHEAHRDALAGAIAASGAAPSQKTAHLDYPPLKTERDILAFAKHVEETAANTYLSALPDLKDARLGSVLGSILGVETVHVATLAQALGEQLPYANGFVG